MVRAAAWRIPVKATNMTMLVIIPMSSAVVIISIISSAPSPLLARLLSDENEGLILDLLDWKRF